MGLLTAEQVLNLTLDSSKNIVRTGITGSALKAAGQVNCSQSDQTVVVAGGFNHVRLQNKDTSITIVFAIDEASTPSPIKPIYVGPLDVFQDEIAGNELHYSSISGTPAFTFALR